MKVLIACEESQRVTIALRENGVEAFSCDLMEPSGKHPEWHIQKDLTEVLKEKWDAIIAFPPCTHLASSGAAWFAKKRADGRQAEGIEFFMMLAKHGCKHIAIENPVGIMSKFWRKPDQYIQPYEYGDPARKKTCLWLKNFPLLKGTKTVKPDLVTYANGKTFSRDFSSTTKGVKRQKVRSKTYPGIAAAIGEQWGNFLKEVW